MKKPYFIKNVETDEFVCKGAGGVGWAFTDDVKKAVKFTTEKAERMVVYAKFDAEMVSIVDYKWLQELNNALSSRNLERCKELEKEAEHKSNKLKSYAKENIEILERHLNGQRSKVFDRFMKIVNK